MRDADRMIDRQAIRKRRETVGSKLDERGRRAFAAGEALGAGWAGLEAAPEIRVRRATIGRGGRIRRCATAERPGSPQGRRPATVVQPGPNAIDDLRRIVEPTSPGSRAAVAMVSKSDDKLAVALQRRVTGSAPTAARLLPALATVGNRTARRTRARASDRDAQFETSMPR